MIDHPTTQIGTTPDSIGVDFDKTLTDSASNEWRPALEQEANKRVVEEVREEYRNGTRVMIWTARQWSEAAQIAGWLTAHEVPHHGLMCGKGGADRYVDDKAMTPEEFTNDCSE
jgi:hydroxymethylpyrimidine pyrophosphatase-like HAD family hydrolase